MEAVDHQQLAKLTRRKRKIFACLTIMAANSSLGVKDRDEVALVDRLRLKSFYWATLLWVKAQLHCASARTDLMKCMMSPSAVHIYRKLLAYRIQKIRQDLNSR